MRGTDLWGRRAVLAGVRFKGSNSGYMYSIDAVCIFSLSADMSAAFPFRTISSGTSDHCVPTCILNIATAQLSGALALRRGSSS